MSDQQSNDRPISDFERVLLNRIAEVDQAVESIRLLGKPVAIFYKGLVDEGVPREDAVEIVKGWMSTMMIMGREQQEESGP